MRGPRATNADYLNSGYARGHMAPAADFAWSAEAIRSTYVLSNAAPQLQSVNAGVWAWLERSVRDLAAASDEVIVFSGPLYEEAQAQTIGPGQVAVPSHFFKVALAVRNGRFRMLGAIVPNDRLPRPLYRSVLTSVDEVERRTGLDFFAAINDALERKLESHSEFRSHP